MRAHPVLLQKKYARVIKLFADRRGIPLEEALGTFYHSELYRLMSEGAGDIHCMSDQWLCRELEEETACVADEHSAQEAHKEDT